MAMLAFSHFEKFKNQFQLIRHLIHDMTLGSFSSAIFHSAISFLSQRVALVNSPASVSASILSLVCFICPKQLLNLYTVFQLFEISIALLYHRRAFPVRQNY
jgi:hypothetical protein